MPCPGPLSLQPGNASRHHRQDKCTQALARIGHVFWQSLIISYDHPLKLSMLLCCLNVCIHSQARVSPAQADFTSRVSQGFQASAVWQQGSMIAQEEGTAGAPFSTVTSASWALSIQPISGWGAGEASGAISNSNSVTSSRGSTSSSGSGAGSSSGSAVTPPWPLSTLLAVAGGALGQAMEGQKATAGWLSLLPIFEPHWQVGGCQAA